MKNQIFNPKGISLIEVIVTMAVGLIVIWGISSLIIYGSQTTAFYGKKRGLQKTISFVMSELENRPLSDLPPLGVCRRRRYDLNGKIKDETDMSATDCIDIDVNPGVYVVAWQTKPQGNIDVQFENPSLMKLPVTSEIVRPVEVFGKFVDPRTRLVITKKVTYFGS